MDSCTHQEKWKVVILYRLVINTNKHQLYKIRFMFGVWCGLEYTTYNSLSYTIAGTKFI